MDTPLERNKILAAINSFIISTTKFMNDFAVNCNVKLDEVDTTIMAVRAMVIQLETKLSGVPDEPQNVAAPQPAATSTTDGASPSDQAPAAPAPVGGSGMSEDPQYAPYYRQLKVGIPPDRVFNKMIVMGIPHAVAEKILAESGKVVALEDML